MMVAALIHAQPVAASLRVSVGDSSEAIVQVVDDRNTGHRLTVDCVTGCARPMHYAASVGDSPMGLVDLDRDGLIYSVLGNGLLLCGSGLEGDASWRFKAFRGWQPGPAVPDHRTKPQRRDIHASKRPGRS
jgi:hypothetical protein